MLRLAFSILATVFMTQAAQAAAPVAASLEGTYTGTSQDNPNPACTVKIVRGVDLLRRPIFNATITTTAGTKVEMKDVKLSAIDEAINETTRMQKADNSFIEGSYAFAVYTYKGVPSDFVPSNNLTATWYDGKVLQIGIVMETQGGPFVDPQSSNQVYCANLVKTN